MSRQSIEALEDLLLNSDAATIESQWHKHALQVTLEARRLVARAIKKHNHQYVANRLRVSRQTVYNWQNGRPMDTVYAYWTVLILGDEFATKPRRKKAAKKAAGETA